MRHVEIECGAKGVVDGGPFDGFEATLVRRDDSRLAVRISVYGDEREVHIAPAQFVTASGDPGDTGAAMNHDESADDNEYVPATSSNVGAPPLDLALLFAPGVSLVGRGSRAGERVSLATRRIGNLALPTGELCVCDPFAFENGAPPRSLGTRVAAGEYPLFSFGCIK